MPNEYQYIEAWNLWFSPRTGWLMHNRTRWFFHPLFNTWWHHDHGFTPTYAGPAETPFVGWIDVDEEGEAVLAQGGVLHVRAQAVNVTEAPPVTPTDKLYFENAALTAHKRLLDKRVDESVEAIVRDTLTEEAERLDGEIEFQALFVGEKHD